MKFGATWFVFACALRLTESTSLTVSLPPSSRGTSSSSPSSTHATLTSGTATQEPLHAVLTRQSTLVFPNIVQAGSYLLDIYARDTVFAPFRVDVKSDGQIAGIWETYRGSPWEDRGGSAEGTNDGKDAVIEAKVLGTRNFYEERPGFSPLSLLKSPMILLALVALAAIFGMPYLMDNMDPEMRAEFEEQQKNSPLAGMTRSIQGQGGPGTSGFDLASWMAGVGNKDGATSTASGTDSREGGTRRRG